MMIQTVEKNLCKTEEEYFLLDKKRNNGIQLALWLLLMNNIKEYKEVVSTFGPNVEQRVTSGSPEIHVQQPVFVYNS